MNIALVGYGKMGKAIEEIALENGHTIGLKIDLDNAADLNAENVTGIDVAIEFTGPHSAFDNVMKCLSLGVPVVCGSTGWLEDYEKAKTFCEAQNGTLIYASNFSIGVNIFFEINRKLAEIMNRHPEYKVSMEEIHHVQKLDAPSGTAVSLANDILAIHNEYNNWNLASEPSHQNSISIKAIREPNVPGTHEVSYESEIDLIRIEHIAHNRKGFALGAVLAAEFLAGKKGIFTMKDVLK